MRKPLLKHGLWGYNNRGCRCAICKKASQDYRRKACENTWSMIRTRYPVLIGPASVECNREWIEKWGI